MTAAEAMDAEKKTPATLTEGERYELAAWQSVAKSHGFKSVTEMEVASLDAALKDAEAPLPVPKKRKSKKS